MSILNKLAKIISPRKKRRGRGTGSGSGAKSGRGTTRHQTAREKVPLHFEGGQNRMVKRFPLLRGKGRNKSIGPRPFLLGLSKLNIFKKGETVNIKSLIEKGILTEKEAKGGVKIVANGILKTELKIELPVSKSVNERNHSKIQATAK